MVLFGLYWRLWSRLMMSLGGNSTGDWRFEKGAFKIDSPSGDEGVDARLEMVALWGIHCSHLQMSERGSHFCFKSFNLSFCGALVDEVWSSVPVLRRKLYYMWVKAVLPPCEQGEVWFTSPLASKVEFGLPPPLQARWSLGWDKINKTKLK